MSSVLHRFRPHSGIAIASLSICVAACEKTPTVPDQPAGTASLLSTGSGYSLPVVLLNAPSEAHAINDNAVIVGAWNDQAFRWEKGVATDIGTPAGCSSSVANDVNNQGVITGVCINEVIGSPIRVRAFRWSPGTGMTLLPERSEGNAIDNLGNIAGEDNFLPAWWDPQNTVHHAPAYFVGRAVGINDLGQIVGSVAVSNTGPPIRAFLWGPGSAFTLLPGLGGQLDEAVDVNDKGLAVGGSVRPVLGGGGSQPDAVRWPASGGIEELGEITAFALAVNNKGRIVGDVGVGLGFHAFTWKGGQAWTLPEGTSSSRSARDVNSCGAIVGSATFADGDHAVLWVRRRCEA